MFEQQLEQSGLTKNQAIVYEALLKAGAVPARSLLSATPLKRGLLYKTLDELVALGIVNKKDEPGKVAVFEPAHPAKLKEIAEQKEKQAQNAQLALNSVLGQLASEYNLTSGKPGLKFYEGVDGVKQIYDDILATSQDFLLVRPIYEPTYEEKIVPIANEFIKKRVARKIKITAITPTDIAKEKSSEDEARLMERVWVDKNLYNAPVEIDIYGNKIAMISYGQELVGTIIESPQISQALRQIFLLAALGAKTGKTIASPAHTAPQLSEPSSPPTAQKNPPVQTP